ncbi:MAG TPA: CDP-alcohol phosphatidyltransferase family protein, partial [Solirubrobacteraceae bacterium]|nr:CDP-alcohol phosphatidyltransferase family protein [Solirubrobacteraceae bacterium]
MQPRPISETSGPFGPSVRVFIALPSRLSCRRPFDRPCAARISCLSVFPLNLPNVLTVLRIMLVPVLVVALLGNTPAGDVLAAVVFALASLND